MAAKLRRQFTPPDFYGFTQPTTAVVGGTLGAYKNLKSPSSRRFEPVIPESGGAAPVPVYKDPDIYEKLIKFDDLRKKGILTDAEFEEQKKRLLAK